MIPGITLHVIIALVWMFLSGNTTLGGLAAGLAAGFGLLALFRKALGCQNYVRRVLAAFAFFGRFGVQIALSNFRLARLALSKNAGELRGEFISYSVEGLSELEILLLCQCIGLTPGTVVTEQIAEENGIILHTFPAGSPDEIRRSLDKELKQPLLAFTRP